MPVLRDRARSGHQARVGGHDDQCVAGAQEQPQRPDDAGVEHAQAVDARPDPQQRPRAAVDQDDVTADAGVPRNQRPVRGEERVGDGDRHVVVPLRQQVSLGGVAQLVLRVQAPARAWLGIGGAAVVEPGRARRPGVAVPPVVAAPSRPAACVGIGLLTRGPIAAAADAVHRTAAVQVRRRAPGRPERRVLGRQGVADAKPRAHPRFRPQRRSRHEAVVADDGRGRSGQDAGRSRPGRSPRRAGRARRRRPAAASAAPAAARSEPRTAPGCVAARACCGAPASPARPAARSRPAPLRPRHDVHGPRLSGQHRGRTSGAVARRSPRPASALSVRCAVNGS